ncbi:hypothetical protein ABZ912_26910 [Nonomuraea angiospora]
MHESYRLLSVAAPFTRLRGDRAVPFARAPARTVREVEHDLRYLPDAG